MGRRYADFHISVQEHDRLEPHSRVIRALPAVWKSDTGSTVPYKSVANWHRRQFPDRRQYIWQHDRLHAVLFFVEIASFISGCKQKNKPYPLKEFIDANFKFVVSSTSLSEDPQHVWPLRCERLATRLGVGLLVTGEKIEQNQLG